MNTPTDMPLPEAPYRGIESFRYVDHPIFFARDDAVQKLLRSVTIYRGVLLYGDSGVGKSSLINAGFLPLALRENFAPHRLRVFPARGSEVIVEGISQTADGRPPYLPSIFSDAGSAAARLPLSVEALEKKLAPFRVTDLEERITLRLTKPSDPLSKYLRAQLPEAINELLDAYATSGTDFQKARKGVADQLKQLVVEKTIYEKRRFAHAPLTKETRELVAQQSKGGEFVYLNQRLLEEAYPPERPPADKYPLLIFDQFEEFVTLFEVAPVRSELKEALEIQEAILNALVRLLHDDRLPIKLLFVFREDYLAKLAKLFERSPELTDQYVRLTPLRAEKLDEVIGGPFKKFPGRFEPELPAELRGKLKEAIISESESGTINLTEVQTVCLRLWHSKEPLALFEQKGIAGLLEDYLSDELNRFPDELRDPAVALLGRLVTSSSVSSTGTRNVVSEDDLIERVRDEEKIPEDLLREALRRLEEETKLVRRERRYNVYFYEIVSEFLVPWITAQKEERRLRWEQRRLLTQVEERLSQEREQEVSRGADFGERHFIAQVEASGVREFSVLLNRPDVTQELILRKHFSDERYQRLHSLALKRSMFRGLRGESKGNVVVIHDVFGSELSISSGGDAEQVWVSSVKLMRGWFDRLRLGEDGRTEFDHRYRVTASGMIKRHYGELLLSLNDWNVSAFSFDWRKDLSMAADALYAKTMEWFGDSEPFHIVTHGMGGLVARTYIKRYRTRWEDMRKKSPRLARGGRLVQLGTPNFGSFSIAQVMTGVEGLVRKIALLDLRHSVQEILGTFNSFVGLYQMLPSPYSMPKAEPLYNAKAYGGSNVPQKHLDRALEHHGLLSDTTDVAPDRFVYVAGFDQPTPVGIPPRHFGLDREDSYDVSNDGDGSVPHRLGLFLKNPHRYDPQEPETLIPTYYVREEHGNLPSNPQVLRALDDLLQKGETPDLHASLRQARLDSLSTRAKGVESPRARDREARAHLEERHREDENRLQLSLRRMSEVTLAQGLASPEERRVEDILTRGFLSFMDEDQSSEADSFEGGFFIEDSQIEIGLVYGSIHSIDYNSLRSAHGRDLNRRPPGKHPVDAISVGHYVGVQPAAAELMLDYAVSASLLGRADIYGLQQSDLILTQYTECGIIHGRLGQPFILPDPRARRDGGRTGRIIALAGMGEPGRLGAPELTVLARGLCWSLGRLNKRHLATVLIGAGAGNLSIREAVTSWMNGIRLALAGSKDDGLRLSRITFVEHDARRIPELDKHIRSEAERQSQLGLRVNYRGPGERELARIKQEGIHIWERSLKRDWAKLEASEPGAGAPTRVTLSLDAARKVYSFAAVTETAVVPERDVRIDPKLITQANDALMSENVPSLQLERGRFLEGLLISDDLRRALGSRAPLVLQLDATTARIHWEMVAQPELSHAPAPDVLDASQAFDGDAFLGTSRSFTRQLRTNFSPPPEPPLQPRRVLRVLVVADPAPDAQRPGAQEEGVAVADLFESYNTIYRERRAETRVEVKSLFGPLEATRTNVLRELMQRSYDVLHFVGHCVFQWDGDPTLTGWVFHAGKRELLSANELTRIDRVPQLVFSSASEMGITPDRSDERSDALAPAFAEAFLERGVANFVCQAWPVDDLAARIFALMLYSGLLGIATDESGQRLGPAARVPKPMSFAVRDARLTIARTAGGRTTWGAYQHYGNPYFRLFYPPELRRIPAPGASRTSGARAAKKATKKAAGKAAKKTTKKAAKKKVTSKR